MSEYLVYTDESGLTPDEKYMLVGALFVPAEIHAELKRGLNDVFGKAKGSARKSRNQFLMKLIQKNDLSTIHSLLKEDKNAFEMKFSNINGSNLQSYKDFTDVLLKYGVKFSVLVIDKSNGSGKFSSWELFVNRYVMLLRSNIERQFQDGDGFSMICDEMTTPKGESMIFEDAIVHKLDKWLSRSGLDRNIRSAITISSHASLLSQACDLLLGCVTSDMKIKQSLSVKQAKVEYAEFVKTKFEIKNLCANVTKKTPFYFSVWHYNEKTGAVTDKDSARTRPMCG